MNKFLNGLTDATNFTLTENGAITHKTTKSDLLDMFALGGAYRNRSDADVILLFKNAYQENPVYALKCLFYLRDVRGGQGERRFFRVAMKWLANSDVEAARRNLKYVAEFGRWDDLYLFVNTALEKDAFEFMKNQLALDMQCKTPSLLAKWLKSENTSSMESKLLAKKTRQYFGMTAKQYRKTLSILRERINVLERLMSAGKWDEIEFDKIPSKAGLIYKNAFARHDIERMKNDATIQSYADFAKDTTKTVNAKALYPYEVVDKAIRLMGYNSGWFRRTSSNIPLDNTDRLMINKYWDNLADYINEANFNGIAVVDKDACKACGKCVATCPRHLIELIPYDSKYTVQCSSNDKGKDVMSACSVGCIGCMLCTKQCEFGAITVVNNVAHIDYSKCTGCGKCAEKCPKKIIHLH